MTIDEIEKEWHKIRFGDIHKTRDFATRHMFYLIELAKAVKSSKDLITCSDCSDDEECYACNIKTIMEGLEYTDRSNLSIVKE